MKTIIFALIACIVTGSCLAQHKTQGVIIQGKLPVNTNGYKVYLDSTTVYLNMHSVVHLDSTVIRDGKFNFSRKMIEPAELQLGFAGVYNNQSFFIPKGLFLEVKDHLLVTMDEHKPTQKPLSGLKFSGSAYQTQYEDIDKATTVNISNKESEILKKIVHKPSADTVKMALAIIEERNKKIATLLTQYIDQHPQYYISLYKFNEQLGRRITDLPDAIRRFNNFSPTLRNSLLGHRIAYFIDSSSKLIIGEIAPDFTALTPDGKTLKLTDLRGKFVLLDFWASWCGPCRLENPNLVKAYNRYKNKNFEILGYSLDTGHNPWVRAIKDDQIAWLQVSDLKGWESSMVKSYLIPSIPSNYLIDPQGKIIAINLRGEMVEKELEKIYQSN